MYFHKELYVEVLRVRVKSGKAQEYLDFRRDEVLPQMLAWPGSVYSILLRDAKKENSWLIVNAWQSPEDADKWTADPAEAVLREKAKTIIAEPLESIGEYTECHL